MITAAQAKETVKEKLREIAQEFITNNIETSIHEALNEGWSFCTVSFSGVSNPENVGKEVVKLLEEEGYKAEHVYCNRPTSYDNYIMINWED